MKNTGPLSHHCEINITSITCILQDNFDLFFDIISFQHVLQQKCFFVLGEQSIGSAARWRRQLLTTLTVTHNRYILASFPGLSGAGEGEKAWGLLRAHGRKLPQNVVIAYYSNLSATFVGILSVKAWERG